MGSNAMCGHHINQFLFFLWVFFIVKRSEWTISQFRNTIYSESIRNKTKKYAINIIERTTKFVAQTDTKLQAACVINLR